jgi:hypothetical protein
MLRSKELSRMFGLPINENSMTWHPVEASGSDSLCRSGFRGVQLAISRPDFSAQPMHPSVACPGDPQDFITLADWLGRKGGIRAAIKQEKPPRNAGSRTT